MHHPMVINGSNSGSPSLLPTRTPNHARWATRLWLLMFCGTGIGLGMAFEFLDLHSRHGAPVQPRTMFLCFIGYWSQTLAGGAYALCLWCVRSSRTYPRTGAAVSPERAQKPTAPLHESWSRPVVCALVGSALLDGGAQALDFLGQVNGGYMLFTIFHSSVTVFSCLIAVLVLKTRIGAKQWLGVLLVVCGILTTSVPSPINVEGSFSLGLGCSLVGSLLLAASYPISELVFTLGNSRRNGGSRGAPISEEIACFMGSLLNTLFYTVWTLCYTVPHWDDRVSSYAKPGHSAQKAAGFAIYGAMVGLHSLSFWKSIHKVGTVPCAVAKGAQQAGVFVFSHIFFCHRDRRECIDYNYGDSLWNRMQKSVAFTLCCSGVLVYALNKTPPSRSPEAVADELQEHGVDVPDAPPGQEFHIIPAEDQGQQRG